MFSFVLVSHPSCVVFRCFALYLAPVLSVFVCVFLYWVRPLVMLLTFAAFAFGVEVYSIGCALRAPHQTLTSVPEREVKKKISLRGFLGVRPSGASPDPRVGPLGGESTPVLGGRGENTVIHTPHTHTPIANL